MMCVAGFHCRFSRTVTGLPCVPCPAILAGLVVQIFRLQPHIKLVEQDDHPHAPIIGTSSTIDISGKRRLTAEGY